MFVALAYMSFFLSPCGPLELQDIDPYAYKVLETGFGNPLVLEGHVANVGCTTQSFVSYSKNLDCIFTKHDSCYYRVLEFSNCRTAAIEVKILQSFLSP
jgi:hypothetical protein